MDFYNLLGDGFRQPVLDLMEATTRALNSYADNAGRPTISYVVQSRTDWATPDYVEEAFNLRSQQKGSD